jgi:hypothetical protein
MASTAFAVVGVVSFTQVDWWVLAAATLAWTTLAPVGDHVLRRR